MQSKRNSCDFLKSFGYAIARRSTMASIWGWVTFENTRGISCARALAFGSQIKRYMNSISSVQATGAGTGTGAGAAGAAGGGGRGTVGAAMSTL